MAVQLTYTLRALARLLSYPDAELRSQLPALLEVLHGERALTFGRLAEIDTLIDRLRATRALEAEAQYVELFDRGRRTALHLFEHVHGDSRDRGPAMVDLIKTYEQAGLVVAGGELPDHLCVLLEYASTQPREEARSLLREVAHILQNLFSGLLAQRSAYASAIGALLDIAGEKAVPVRLPEEQPLDEAWAEPEAFGGCSTAGQARPGAPQPVQIVRKTNPAREGARA
jgi:nitrate reductase molybdenum cofactor assembly chaperone NarJ/NarW